VIDLADPDAPAIVSEKRWSYDGKEPALMLAEASGLPRAYRVILTDSGPLAMGDGDWLLTDSDGARHVVTDGEHSSWAASRGRSAA
jgi:hypothetical protein